MSRFANWARTSCAGLCIAGSVFSSSLQAEQFVAAPTHEVGPKVAGQVSPAPSGGWQNADDRILNASVNGQGGWQTITYSSRYDEEIATGIAHSGGHSWRLSNWFHTGLVNPILSPAFGPVSESGAASHVVYEFWFRSATVQADPGNYTSTTISDAPGNRMTYLGMFDERPGDIDSGCPNVAEGCFHLDAVEVVSGDDAAADGDATFVDHYSSPLQRGVWYRARVDATFVAGPGAQTGDPALCPAGAPAGDCHVGNDHVRYQVFDGNGNPVFDSGTIGSWEAAYYDGRYGNLPGTVVSMTNVAFRVSANADDGTQQPFDTNSVSARPQGVYIDDLSVTPDSGTAIKTSFDFDRFVATSGSDTSPCTDPAHPCRTIVYAIGQSNPYDTIHVAAGIYAEQSGAAQNLLINKPVAIEGAKAGIDARTRNIAAGETIIVPSSVDASLTASSQAAVAVVDIESPGVSVDGVIIDGDNTALTSPFSFNGTNPDADTGIFATRNHVAVQNTLVRNVTFAGIYAFENSGAGGDNVFQFNRFANITNPSTWGIGIYAGYNFYAQIDDNLFDQVRIGIQFAENDYLADPGMQAPSVSRNEIHATRTGLFMNLFYSQATTWTVSGNHIFASSNASQSNQWTGFQIESMLSDQTANISANVIDGNAVLGARRSVGYLLNNIVSTQSANTAIDGGSVGNVDVGVLATDATNFTGPVNGFIVRNTAFNGVALGAIYVEDTDTIAGSAAITIGGGNTYSGTAHRLAISGVAPGVSFSGSGGSDDVLVRAAGNDFFGIPNSNSCPATCTVSNASIDSAIALANTNGTVFVDSGTFDEAVVIGSGRNGMRVTSNDVAHPATLTRSTGGPNQPVLVIAGTAGAAPTDVRIDHLNFAVDKAHAAEGVLASGFVDGLIIDSNTFVQSASATSGTASYKFTNGIAINIDPLHNSLGLPRGDGSSVTITNNTLSGSSSPNPTQFRAGIAVDGSVGVLSGNQSSGLNHDAIIRFATHVSGGGNGWSISANTFTGGGLEFDAPNAGITPIVIDANTIASETTPPALLSAALSTPQTAVEADLSSLRLIDNYQNLPVTVSNNTISGYANGFRGALVQNFPHATFTDNTFTPRAGATDFASLVVGNKEINTDNPAEPPYLMTFTALRNTFNDSGIANAGRAVEFINDNDANGSAAFGAITFGSALASDANQFSASHRFQFNLIDETCDTRVAPGTPPQCTFLDYNDVGSVQNTQVRPFRGNVYAVNNLFGGVAPGAMSPAQEAQLNAQTFDINDAPGLGLVNYGFSGGVDIALQGPVANVQVGVTTPYTARLSNTGNALGENALIHFAVSRTVGIHAGDLTLQYFDGSAYQLIALNPCGPNLCGTFGPQPGGFPVGAGYDATTLLHTTFAVADTYAVDVQLQGVNTGVIYAADSLSTQVVQSAAQIGLALSGPQAAIAGATTGPYLARLTNTGGATTENVLVHFVISRNPSVGSGDVTIQFNTGSGFQPIPLTPCGQNLCGTFGPSGSFPVPVGFDQTTQLLTIYAKSGVFDITTTVDGTTSNQTYASASLQVTVGAGAAAKIAANSSTSIIGTAGTSAAPLPSVIVTDAADNPVAGYAVTFAAGANSGTLSGVAQMTNAAGVATLGAWTLGTAATETVTVTASLDGSPITFTATVTSQFDLAVNVTDNHPYVQYGHTLDYAIVVSNAGPSTATQLVSDNLPPELDLSSATWQCLAHTTNATCTASGFGNLTDSPTIPAGGSVTYVISATVLIDPVDETIVNQVTVDSSGDSDASNNTATSTTSIVIFRNGFEVDNSGVVGSSSAIHSIGVLDDAATLTLDPSNAPQASTLPTVWLRATDAQQREAFRIEIVRGSDGTLVRIVSTDANGAESHSAWTALKSAAIGVAGKSGAYVALLVTGSSEIHIVIPAWATLPLTVQSVD
ncbi:MAG: hypothetical protein ABJB01_06650 [Rudaea sp.]